MILNFLYLFFQIQRINHYTNKSNNLPKSLEKKLGGSIQKDNNPNLNMSNRQSLYSPDNNVNVQQFLSGNSNISNMKNMDINYSKSPDGRIRSSTQIDKEVISILNSFNYLLFRPT